MALGRNSVAVQLNVWLTRLGLKFPATTVEASYQEYASEIAFNIARFSMGLAVFTYAAFGVWDLTSAMGGLHSTRFRYMVACPLLATFVVFSYRPSIKRFWQQYTLVFCLAAIACLFFQIIFHDAETEFKIARGNATLTLMLAAIFSGLFPISILRVLIVQVQIQIVHAATLIYDGTQTLSVATFDAFYISCASTVVCLISYWREMVMRRGFSERMSDNTKLVADENASFRHLGATRPESGVVRITISYRRDDSGVITGRIFDRLAAHYGTKYVFRDIDHIPPGADFRRHLEEMLDRSDVILAIMGPAWVGPIERGNRLSSPADPVRVEVETALRKGKLLIPVLVLGGSMPSAEELPETLQDLAYRHAVSVDAGLDFDVHMERLIRAIDRLRDDDGLRNDRPASEGLMVPTS